MAVEALRPWVRAVDARDAGALVALHRELWVDHDLRGGMPAAREDAVWQSYGELLQSQIAHRDGRRTPAASFEGKLGHFVVEHRGEVVGQVEVYLDRYGMSPKTPHVAELRSLIVSPRARGLGLGAALVIEVARVVHQRAGRRTLVAAEVLARNEALRFYDRLGFRTLERLVAVSVGPEKTLAVEPVDLRDAEDLAFLDHDARQRRAEWGDPRFDPPIPPTPELVRMIEGGISQDLIQAANVDPTRLREELVAHDRRGRGVSAGHLMASILGVPFAPEARAEITRLASDPEDPTAREGALSVVAEALQRAQAFGARELLVRLPFLHPLGDDLLRLPHARPFSWILAAPAAKLLG